MNKDYEVTVIVEQKIKFLMHGNKENVLQKSRNRIINSSRDFRGLYEIKDINLKEI